MVSSNAGKPSARLQKSRQQQKRELSTANEQKNPAPSYDTPYRLPKINLFSNSFTNIETDTGHNVWSRHGYDVYQQKPVNLAELSRQFRLSPMQLTHEMRRVATLTASYPKFECAAIQPHMPGHPKFYTAPPVDHIYCNRSARTPVSMKQIYADRSIMPTTSRSVLSPNILPNVEPEQRQLHWMLAPYKNLTFDKSGSGIVQGPYSREFSVHCKAPTTWKRMIWGSKPGSPLIHRCRPPPPLSSAVDSRTVRTPRIAR